MKSLISVVGAATLALIGMPLAATPDEKPVNAADVDDYLGCNVRASDTTAYVYDATCDAHRVIKRNKDGTVRSMIYQDKSQLLDGQTAPDHAVQYVVTQSFYGLACTGTEVISPSGQYMSNLRCF